jgi:hypothetical protein
MKWAHGALDQFWWKLWPETVREFGQAGVRFEMTAAIGGIWRPVAREPVVTGLARGVLNLVVTDRIPLEWDNGRILSGVTTLYRGWHLCMIGLTRAHGNQIPLLSTNTCVHELLHALMGDIFEFRPAGWRGQTRETRVDWCATSLWLFHGCAGLRESARRYVERLRA